MPLLGTGIAQSIRKLISPAPGKPSIVSGQAQSQFPLISKQQPKTSQDMTSDLLVQRNHSQEYLRANYWEKWTTAYQNYQCEEEGHPDPNDPTKIDETQTAIGMPDTFGLVRRFVARITAQPPAHRFISPELEIADRISRGLMWQWDKGKIRKKDKKHVTQAAIFGISLRPWYWSVEHSLRKRRIDPLNPPTQDLGGMMIEQYGQKFAQYLKEEGLDPSSPQLLDPMVRAQLTPLLAKRLVGDIGKGQLVPIEYMYKCYEGPKCDFLFIGDVYFPANYMGLEEDKRGIIVERRRGKQYFIDLVKLYQQQAIANPGLQTLADDLREAVLLLFREFPNGSPLTTPGQNPTSDTFRRHLLDSVDQTDSTLTQSTPPGMDTVQWTVLERHVPGEQAYLEMLAEGSVWLGRFPYPYDLEGRIAFTELTFIDNILSGIGDSVPIMVRGINKLHNRQVGQREDLVDALLRPLVATTDRHIYNNPDLLKRYAGLRLVHTSQGPGSIQVIGEQAALASANASLADESALQRMLQVASGESNLSMSADVDPQQLRTATGAKISARSADILTKSDQFSYETSCHDDLEMMYLLNRSELSEPISINKTQYGRTPGMPPVQTPSQGDADEYISATPEDFQYDGEIEVEVGSTLSDDDDTKLTRAQQMYQLAVQAPQNLNVGQATQDLLRAYGKGKELAKWAPPPPPPPKEPTRTSAAVTAQYDKLSPEEKVIFLTKMYDLSPDQLASIRGQQPPPQAGMRDQPGGGGVAGAPDGSPAAAVPGQPPNLSSSGATGAPAVPPTPNGLDAKDVGEPGMISG